MQYATGHHRRWGIATVAGAVLLLVLAVSVFAAPKAKSSSHPAGFAQSVQAVLTTLDLNLTVPLETCADNDGNGKIDRPHECGNTQLPASTPQGLHVVFEYVLSSTNQLPSVFTSAGQPTECAGKAGVVLNAVGGSFSSQSSGKLTVNGVGANTPPPSSGQTPSQLRAVCVGT